MKFKVAQLLKENDDSKYIVPLNPVTISAGSSENQMIITGNSFIGGEWYYLKVTLKNTSNETNLIRIVVTSQYVSEVALAAGQTFEHEFIFVPARKGERITFNGEGSFTITKGNICKVNNIIEDCKGTELYKIGIQGQPNQMFCINGEGFQVGSTGIFEILSDYIVKGIGFIPLENKLFSLDYQYIEGDKE